LRPASSRGSGGHGGHHGFTMVELIVVIVLIGIIGTVAAARFFERSTADTVAWAEQVRSMLRHGQKVAVAQNHPVFVLLGAGRVALCLAPLAACPAASQVRAPGGANSGSAPTRDACASDTWMCEAPPAGVAMTVPAASIGFDGLGRAGGGSSVITVKGDGITRAIGIDGETGYVD
jgi:MSHA pilin protein MshC